MSSRWYDESDIYVALVVSGRCCVFARRLNEVEIVCNMYRVKPAVVYGLSQLCLIRNLQVTARP
jgi:hypothetical protein